MSNQVVIGNRTFSIGTIPPVEAIRVEVAIARVIGEPLFKAFTEKGKSLEDQKGAVGAAIGLMASKMEPDELINTMKTVFSYVSCDGNRIDMNATFVGKNKELWLVFIEALKLNFADFFPADLFASLQKAIQK